MSRIEVPALNTATGATADVYAQVKQAAGSIPNLFAALGYLAPETLQAVLDAEGVLAGKSTSVSIRSFVRWGILVTRSYELSAIGQERTFTAPKHLLFNPCSSRLRPT